MGGRGAETGKVETAAAAILFRSERRGDLARAADWRRGSNAKKREEEGGAREESRENSKVSQDLSCDDDSLRFYRPLIALLISRIREQNPTKVKNWS